MALRAWPGVGGSPGSGLARAGVARAGVANPRKNRPASIRAVLPPVPFPRSCSEVARESGPTGDARGSWIVRPSGPPQARAADRRREPARRSEVASEQDDLSDEGIGPPGLSGWPGPSRTPIPPGSTEERQRREPRQRRIETPSIHDSISSQSVRSSVSPTGHLDRGVSKRRSPCRDHSSGPSVGRQGSSSRRRDEPYRIDPAALEPFHPTDAASTFHLEPRRRQAACPWAEGHLAGKREPLRATTGACTRSARCTPAPASSSAPRPEDRCRSEGPRRPSSAAWGSR